MTIENIGESVVEIPAPRVLCVDDDPNVLLALRRTLCRAFSVDGASSAAEGLTLLSKHRYAVVITDLAMPIMNGIDFLIQARTLAPDVTRLLLTGRADFAEAIAATNTGQVFRFLAKPYQIEELLATVADAVDHHRRVMTDRVALQETLAGILPTLIELASVLHPGVAERAHRTRQATRRLASAASLSDAWELDATGLITLVACVTSPTARWLADLGLDETEHRLLERSLDLARQTFSALPRFEAVGQVLEAATSNHEAADRRPLAARLLLRWQALHDSSVEPAVALEQLCTPASGIPQSWFDALQSIDGPYETHETPVPVDDLQPGMVMAADVIVSGSQRQVLLRQGSTLTRPVLERIRNYARSSGILEPILIAEQIRVKTRPEHVVRRALAVGGPEAELCDPAVSGTWRTK